MSPERPSRLKQRADFQRAARGVRVHGIAFTLQAGPRGDTMGAAQPRIGFTVTKKVGNAVERNRIRRRLREAVRLAPALSTLPQTDYVVVARREVLTVPFATLIGELEGAMRRSGGRLAKGGAGHRRRGVT